MADTAANAAPGPRRKALAGEIEEAMAQLRDTVAGLGRLLADYGTASPGAEPCRAGAASDPVLAQARHGLHDLRRGLAALERPLRRKGRSPGPGWFFLALGLGLFLSFFVPRLHLSRRP